MGRTPILPPWWVAAPGTPTRAARRASASVPPRRRGVMVTLLTLGVVAGVVRMTGLVPAADIQTAHAGPLAAPASPVAVHPPADPCPMDWRAGTGAVKRLIACEAAVWKVPGGAAMAFDVAHCESRFQTAAFNPTGCGGSGCTGLFQQSLRYWRDRAIEYGFAGAPPSDARANIVVSMRMAAEKGTWARDWPVCGR